MQRATSLVRTSTCANWFIVLNVMFAWLSTAPFGRPVVPLV